MLAKFFFSVDLVVVVDVLVHVIVGGFALGCGLLRGVSVVKIAFSHRLSSGSAQ